MHEPPAGLVRDAFGLALVSWEPVRGGTDEAARTFRCVDDEGRAWAVRVVVGGRPGAGAASGALAVLAAVGVPGVPALRPTLAGQRCEHRAGTTVTVTAWVDGPTALDAGLTRAGWRALGVLLARVHRPLLDPGFVGIGSDHYEVRDVVELARAVLPSEPGVLALADRVEDLAALVRAQVAARAVPRVLTHTDPHQGNVIVDGAGSPWLVDWADAMASDPERDLGFVLGGGIFPQAPVGDDEQAAFLAGYRSVVPGFEPDEVRLEHHRAHRLLFDVADWTRRARDTALPVDEREAAGRIAARLLDQVRS